jgi:acrylyl-CoA reductase (NADPH)
MAPLPRRAEAWARLARDLDLAKLDALTTEITLDGALAAGAEILAGRVRGRLVVDVNR